MLGRLFALYSQKAKVSRYRNPTKPAPPQELKRDAKIQSPMFEAAGRDWRLSLLVGGDCANSAEYVSLLVELADSEAAPQAKIEFAIVTQAGERVLAQTAVKASSGNQINWACSKFINRAQLLDETRGFMLNDTVTFEVKLDISSSQQHRTKWQLLGQDEASSAVSALLDSSGLDADVTLIVESEEIRAHNAVLSARSPVFKAMFSHKMVESLEGKVTIDAVPLATFRELLRFIYTGRLSSNFASAPRLKRKKRSKTMRPTLLSCSTLRNATKLASWLRSAPSVSRQQSRPTTSSSGGR